MLENREDPGTEGAEPAGVEDEEDAEEQEGEESGPAETLWLTRGFFRPCRITTNVSKPRAAFTTSWRAKDDTFMKSCFYKAQHISVKSINYINSVLFI